MKATGIIRRIDDLGRVVIPREIRRNARIVEGDPLEIFVEGDMVCFKKYRTEVALLSEINCVDEVLDICNLTAQQKRLLSSKLAELREMVREIEKENA